MLPNSSIIQSELDSYNLDYIGIYRGDSKIVLKPNNIDQIQRIIRYCKDRRIAICPQGGNTGLVGGSVPVFDEVILNLSSMNSILKFDEHLGTVEIQAGVILDDLSKYCEDKNFIVPLDLGAKGSCFIGGNIATNAGGNRLIRYKSLHENVIGLEVVTGDGNIINTLSSTKRKSNQIDLGQLFIGSEGTLGIITSANILLASKPLTQKIAFIACNSFKDVLDTLKYARQHLEESMSAFEMMDCYSFNLVANYIPSFKSPLQKSYPFYVLIEISGSNSSHDMQKLDNFLEKTIDNCVADGIISMDLRQIIDL